MNGQIIPVDQTEFAELVQRVERLEAENEILKLIAFGVSQIPTRETMQVQTKGGEVLAELTVNNEVYHTAAQVRPRQKAGGAAKVFGDAPPQA